MASIRIREPWKLLAAIVLCNGAGLIGSAVTDTGSGSWYDLLIKPEFNPPSWIFAPVWTSLYILMGIALYLVWIEGSGRRDVRVALTLFGAQLLLNVLWSFFFFGLQSPLFGLLEILVLWIFILLTIAAFYRIKHNAAYLLIPYLLWVSFAAYLTYTIWVLN